jgi:intraflagellar transport protein 172
MKLKYKGNFLHPRYDKINDLNRISAIAYAPTDNKVAIANVQEKILHVLDASLTKQDKIPTKSIAGSDSKILDDYYVTDMKFNGDGTKLAVAQSDGGVFVYKIGQEFKEKKSIVNKFIDSSKIVQILYVDEYTLIFVTAAGDLKMGNLRSNKSSTIVSASSTSFGSIVHADNYGELIVFLFEDGTFGKYDLSSNELQIKLNVCANAVVISAGIGSSALIITSDGKIHCYDTKSGNHKYEVINSGGVSFKHTHKSSSGKFMIFASKNELMLISFDAKQGIYSELDRAELNGEESNNYILSRVCMNPSGNRILLGSVFGHLDLLEVGGKKVVYNDIYEIEYHGSDQATVSKSGKVLLNIKSKASLPITRVLIKNDRFIVVETSKSLIITDLIDLNQEQVEVDFNWTSDQNDSRYYFHEPGFCIVRASEDVRIINLIPFKGAHTAYSVKPYRFERDCISLRISKNTIFAAFMDSKGLIRISNLNASVVLKEINVSGSVKFISLSNDCERLLYFDDKRRLMLVDLKNVGSTRVLLEDCSYSSWLPDSNKALIAQSRNVLTVWYNIDSDLYQNIELKGNAIYIKPAKDTGVSSSIVVSNTSTQENYEIELERSLIDFSIQLDGGNMKRYHLNMMIKL